VTVAHINPEVPGRTLAFNCEGWSNTAAHGTPIRTRSTLRVLLDHQLDLTDAYT